MRSSLLGARFRLMGDTSAAAATGSAEARTTPEENAWLGGGEEDFALRGTEENVGEDDDDGFDTIVDLSGAEETLNAAQLAEKLR